MGEGTRRDRGRLVKTSCAAAGCGASRLSLALDGDTEKTHVESGTSIISVSAYNRSSYSF